MCLYWRLIDFFYSFHIPFHSIQDAMKSSLNIHRLFGWFIYQVKCITKDNFHQFRVEVHIVLTLIILVEFLFQMGQDRSLHASVRDRNNHEGGIQQNINLCYMMFHSKMCMLHGICFQICVNIFSCSLICFRLLLLAPHLGFSC